MRETLWNQASTLVRAEGRLRAHEARCPVGLWVEPSQWAEYRAAQAQRQAVAQLLLGHVHAVTAIAGQVLVAAVARQCDGHASTGGLAYPVGGHSRAVGKRLAVQPAQPVDQVEVIAADGVQAVVGGIAVGDLLRIARFVVRGHIETNRAGLDRLINQTGHQCDDGAGVDAPGQEGAEWHLGDQADIDRLAQALDQCLFGICL